MNAFEGKFGDEYKVTYEDSKTSWKIKFEIPDGAFDSIKGNVQILKVKEHCYAVDFTRKSGEKMKFLDFYNKLIKQEDINLYNDLTS